MPPNLQTANISHNLITDINDDFPQTLVSLDCSYNLIAVISHLNDVIREMNISSNPIVYLPFDMDSLVKILSNDNRNFHHKMIRRIPPNIVNLELGNCGLLKIVCPLPKSLKHLNCTGNPNMQFVVAPEKRVAIIGDSS